MPGRDGTGPAGAGAKTGRGLGGCAGASASGQTTVVGAGRQRRAGRGGMQGRGFGRGFGRALDAVSREPIPQPRKKTLWNSSAQSCRQCLIKSMVN